jgi:hypothetical protein
MGAMQFAGEPFSRFEKEEKKRGTNKNTTV